MRQRICLVVEIVVIVGGIILSINKLIEQIAKFSMTKAISAGDSQ